MAGKNPLEATGSGWEDSVQSGQEQSYRRSGEVLFVTQGMGVCSQERSTWRPGRGSNEKGRRELTKGHVTGQKGAKQSREVLFQFVPRPHTHTHWQRWSPWSTMDKAHVPGPSTVLHHRRWGGPGIF